MTDEDWTVRKAAGQLEPGERFIFAEDLPLTVVLNLIDLAGARIIVNEKRADVQGQVPVGPVSQES